MVKSGRYIPCFPCSIKLNRMIASINKTVLVVVDGRTVTVLIGREITVVIVSVIWFLSWNNVSAPVCQIHCHSIIRRHIVVSLPTTIIQITANNRGQPLIECSHARSKGFRLFIFHQDGNAKYSTWYTVRDEQYLSKDLVMGY